MSHRWWSWSARVWARWVSPCMRAFRMAVTSCRDTEPEARGRAVPWRKSRMSLPIRSAGIVAR